MGDTVILPTTRDGIVRKLTLITKFFNSRGIKINAKKTKFIVFNGSEVDSRPITVNNVSVDLCEQYVYLVALLRLTALHPQPLRPMHKGHVSCAEIYCLRGEKQ